MGVRRETSPPRTGCSRGAKAARQLCAHPALVQVPECISRATLKQPQHAVDSTLRQFDYTHRSCLAKAGTGGLEALVRMRQDTQAALKSSSV
eukprot:231403-Prorocentrum_minimum.AAC.3